MGNFFVVTKHRGGQTRERFEDCLDAKGVSYNLCESFKTIKEAEDYIQDQAHRAFSGSVTELLILAPIKSAKLPKVDITKLSNVVLPPDLLTE